MLTTIATLSLILAAETTTMNATETPTTSNNATEARSERIRRTFHEVRVDTLHLLDDLYAEDMVFQDPLERFEGLEEFKIYMEAMYQYVEDIQWEFKEEVVQGDTHVFFWTMTLQTEGLNKGKPFDVDGISHIKFGDQDKVVYHRDYFDMGAYIYERAPVVRCMVNFVKRRLHKAVKETREEIRAQRE